MRPRCPFCGTLTGPFKEVGGLFTLLMCGACRAARRSGPGLEPIEVVVCANVLEPYPQWACPLGGCDYRAELPWPLERHAAAEHPEWTATFGDDPWRSSTGGRRALVRAEPPWQPEVGCTHDARQLRRSVMENGCATSAVRQHPRVRLPLLAGVALAVSAPLAPT